MKKSIVYFFFLLLLLPSCKKEAIIDHSKSFQPLDKNIDLSNIQWGQVSKYVAYQAYCRDVDGTFEYLGDTLVVKVIEELEELFIEESLTPYSTSFLNGEVTETFRYPVILESGKVVLKERSNSRLFFFYDNDFLPLDFPALMPTAYQEGCRLNLGETPFVGGELVQFPSFEVGPITLYNKAAVSCRPIVEGDGYLIYDKDRLYMSHTITSVIFDGYTSTWLSGWRLLEE